MTRPEIRAALHSVARAELSLDGPLPQGPLSGHLDSVQLLTLVVGIEDRFQISLDPEDEAGVDTVEDLVALVEAKLGHGERAHA